MQKRELLSDYWEQHLIDIWGPENGEEVTMKEIERGVFKDKAVMVPQEAFAFLEEIEAL